MGVGATKCLCWGDTDLNPFFPTGIFRTTFPWGFFSLVWRKLIFIVFLFKKDELGNLGPDQFKIFWNNVGSSGFNFKILPQNFFNDEEKTDG